MKNLHIKITAKPLSWKELKSLVLKWRIIDNTLPCFSAVGWVNEFSRYNWIKFYRGNRINYRKQLKPGKNIDLELKDIYHKQLRP